MTRDFDSQRPKLSTKKSKKENDIPQADRINLFVSFVVPGYLKEKSRS